MGFAPHYSILFLGTAVCVLPRLEVAGFYENRAKELVALRAKIKVTSCGKPAVAYYPPLGVDRDSVLERWKNSELMSFVACPTSDLMQTSRSAQGSTATTAICCGCGGLSGGEGSVLRVADDAKYQLGVESCTTAITTSTD